MTLDSSATVEVQSRVSTEHSPWQVSQLSKSLKDWIDKLGRVWVEAEVAQINFQHGKMFAEIRDLSDQFSVSIHAWNPEQLPIDLSLKQGDRVLALVKPQFWPKNGKLSMQVLEMKKLGLGELLERIERLRAALVAEGLTSPARKKPLPFLPNKIGLITGANSDAEKDVLQNARLRWPQVEFEVINTLVQGDKAAAEVIMAMLELDANPEVDVIIVARGGGSFQDLLVFSDERLVRQATQLSKPIVSAIGHENDRPLLDDVADLRASTPTDAAKRVVPDVVEEKRKLTQMRDQVVFRVGTFIDAELQRLAAIRSRPMLASPFGFVEQLQFSLQQQVKLLTQLQSSRLETEAASLVGVRDQLRSLSPEETLKRGYSVVVSSNGKAIQGQLKAGDEIVIKNFETVVDALVQKVAKR